MRYCPFRKLDFVKSEKPFGFKIKDECSLFSHFCKDAIMSSVQILIWEKESDSSGLTESDEQRDAPSRP